MRTVSTDADARIVSIDESLSLVSERGHLPTAGTGPATRYDD